jgi:hypothetical protein
VRDEKTLAQGGDGEDVTERKAQARRRQSRAYAPSALAALAPHPAWVITACTVPQY